MNKIMQAVNDLRGDLGNSLWFMGYEKFLYLSQRKRYVTLVRQDTDKWYQYICTVREFNSLVAELSAAEWIK